MPQTRDGQPAPSAPFPTLPAEFRQPTGPYSTSVGDSPEVYHAYHEAAFTRDEGEGRGAAPRAVDSGIYNNVSSPGANMTSQPSQHTSHYNQLSSGGPGQTNADGSAATSGGMYLALDQASRQSAAYGEIPSTSNDDLTHSQEVSSDYHQYFVLEQQGSDAPKTFATINTNRDSVPHEYFVLEKN